MATDKDITQWVYEYSDELISWAFYKISDQSAAQDLVQETFLAAVKSKQDFERRSSPKTWLFSILNKKIVDYYRSKNKFGWATTPLDEDMVEQVTRGYFDDAGSWAEATSTISWDADVHLLDNPDFKKVMDQCMDELPVGWNMAIVAKYYSEKSSSEICQDLRITPSNYWQIVHRAKLLLKKCIETHWEA
ncbi:MAG: sigma-70 family RNA polymerase sigma factor [Cyclonatronaceae bacterium]